MNKYYQQIPGWFGDGEADCLWKKLWVWSRKTFVFLTFQTQTVLRKIK